MNERCSGQSRIREFARCGEGLCKLAEETTPDRFPHAFLTLLRNTIRFDGATLGQGWAGNAISCVRIESGHVFGRHPDLIHEWKLRLNQDPLVERFLQGLETPLACSLPDFYRRHGAISMQAFALQHELSQILLFGDVSKGTAHWIALYRRTAMPFDDVDALFLRALWPMYRGAMRINLLRTLERSDETRDDWARAVLTVTGRIEAADSCFAALLAEEAPSHGGAIPARIMQVLMQGRAYRGRSTEIRLKTVCGRAVCTIRRRPGAALLSPAEKRVAEHLVAGLSYKQIALRTGTSPNTVRNQIAQMYRKLGVHDKLALISALHLPPSAAAMH